MKKEHLKVGETVQKNYRKIDNSATIRNILDKINSSIGYSVNIDKFNERINDTEFIIGAAKFVGVDVVYN